MNEDSLSEYLYRKVIICRRCNNMKKVVSYEVFLENTIEIATVFFWG